jgi:16S rRNA (cytosine1402-N4)-methyltransferase
MEIMTNLHTTTDRHIPVLLHEVQEMLSIQSDDCVIDATLGAGGHAAAILEKLGSKGIYVGIDQDTDQLAITRQYLDSLESPAAIHTVHNNFRNIAKIIAQLKISPTKILFDLGLSSMQLDTPSYGMSFRFDAPLSMVMDKENAIVTAFDAVNDWEEETLADIIYVFGDERYARRIASAIVEMRAESPIRTTFELVEVIKQATPKKYHHGKIHPATKTFQAIRIAVNDEYTALREGLQGAIDIIESDGRLAVITFHSGEDRIVKHMFKDRAADKDDIEIVTKKPRTSTEAEIKENPRARSAKLRVIIKK